MEQALFRARQNAQKLNKCVQKLPGTAILLGVLKSLECEFHKRGLTHRTGHPLWFLAETERNIFLWRNGYSLENIKDFEFWIEPEKLITKRCLQLENPGIGNPFVNQSWNNNSQDSEHLQKEKIYLDELSSRLNSIIEHAHALSVAGSDALKDIAPNLYAPKERVLLPLAKRSN